MAEEIRRPPGLLLSDDLIFASRITGTARSLGYEVKTSRTADGFLELARQQPPRGVILDLACPGLAPEALLEGWRAACPVMPRVVAYGSHVDTDTLRAARAAGCDPVLPRSKFVEDMPRELPAWLEGG